MSEIQNLRKELAEIMDCLDLVDSTPFGKIGHLLDKAADHTSRAVNMAEKIAEAKGNQP